jgi:uncharacterized protein (TIGR02757 family)
LQQTLRLLEDLKSFLEKKAGEYNHPSFIQLDPVSIPHRYKKKQDIEIAGLFAAVFAWGNRKTIINKSAELMQLFDNKPYEFCLYHQPSDLRRLLAFRHRTFTATDLLYFIAFLHHHYSVHSSLESAFTRWMKPGDANTENALKGFHDYFFALEEVPARTRKHIASPASGSTCKRLNMFLRWMVRRDKNGVDFGIWKKIKPSQLVCPIDLHVARVSRKLGLLNRKQTDWKAAIELTGRLKLFDPDDPVRYDLALFGMGVTEKF